mmetsp:Transcript_41179/g.94994  ORF Transcript_41179/g.94994 Transcript_41179/m.94994 type:complete len:452 (+) Transcript_41179:265-1620(+)
MLGLLHALHVALVDLVLVVLARVLVDRVHNHVGDTAVVVAACLAVVAILAPFAAPRVLDHPVVNTVLLAVRDEEDAVVQVGRVARVLHGAVAVRWGVDRASLTVLGARDRLAADDAVDVVVHAVGVDGDRERPVLEHVRGHQVLVLGAHGDHLVALNVSELVVLVRLEGLGDEARVAGRGVLLVVHHDALVRVRAVGDKAAGLGHVLHGGVHVAALAAVHVAVASHDLLLRERDELTGGEEVGALHVSGGGEGPARAAVLLVLHRGYSAELAPVEVGRPILAGVLFETRVRRARGAVVLRSPGELAIAHRANRALQTAAERLARHGIGALPGHLDHLRRQRRLHGVIARPLVAHLVLRPLLRRAVGRLRDTEESERVVRVEEVNVLQRLLEETEAFALLIVVSVVAAEVALELREKALNVIFVEIAVSDLHLLHRLHVVAVAPRRGRRRRL